MQLDNTFQLKQSQPAVLPKATFEELKNHHSHRPYTYMVDVYEPQESNVRQRLSPEMADMVLENGQDGYFGNPFRLGAEEPRGATLERFREWAVNRMATDEEYRLTEKWKNLVYYAWYRTKVGAKKVYFQYKKSRLCRLPSWLLLHCAEGFSF